MINQSSSAHERVSKARLPLSTLTLLVTALAFVAASHAQKNEAWVVGEPVMVTTAGGSRPTVSSDGGWLAYQVDGGISKIPTGGGEAQVLVATGREPDWSRSGNLIVFRADTGIHTVDAVTRVVALVSSPGGWDDDPAWSPLGDEIAVQSSSNSIAIVSYPGGQVTTIPCLDPDNSQCEGEGPTWAPDGLWLAFEDGTDILKIPRAGGTAVNVYSYIDTHDITQPVWSWNGQWIAMAREFYAAGDYEIWVIDARGAAEGLHQVTAGPGRDLHPAWSPDGRTIYFSSNRSGSDQIWKVAAPTVPAEQSSWGSIKAGFH